MRPSFLRCSVIEAGWTRTLAVAAILLSLPLLDGTRAWSDDAVETIVLVRHGEKPDKGLGQLDCQGLNRALALPPVIAKTFGRPSAVFIVDGHKRKAIGSNARGYSGIRVAKVKQPQPERSSF
jgi:hypothetical protein